jgi:hypothetical protein
MKTHEVNQLIEFINDILKEGNTLRFRADPPTVMLFDWDICFGQFVLHDEDFEPSWTKEQKLENNLKTQELVEAYLQDIKNKTAELQ